ncbi:hypothetical protein EK21DRAFT_91226 [Setomelanomma holmii]|uniref:Uncharacterized protein n=1 Tax=Setomelanomma holmii TaxID=210430 RepID=A0A9P4H683_9PLEO|nr:hypothetical protein EK21DRAFT_91226 [Setomelanomma holmii]
MPYWLYDPAGLDLSRVCWRSPELVVTVVQDSAEVQMHDASNSQLINYDEVHCQESFHCHFRPFTQWTLFLKNISLNIRIVAHPSFAFNIFIMTRMRREDYEALAARDTYKWAGPEKAQYNRLPTVQQYAYIVFAHTYDNTREHRNLKGWDIIRFWRHDLTDQQRRFRINKVLKDLDDDANNVSDVAAENNDPVGVEIDDDYTVGFPDAAARKKDLSWRHKVRLDPTLRYKCVKALHYHDTIDNKKNSSGNDERVETSVLL